jgi:hypothetical protein
MTKSSVQETLMAVRGENSSFLVRPRDSTPSTLRKKFVNYVCADINQEVGNLKDSGHVGLT